MERKINFIVDKTNILKVGDEEFGREFLGGAFELPFPTQPIKGEHDYQTCDGCQELLKNIAGKVQKQFDKFPNCCKSHAKLTGQPWFDVSEFHKLNITQLVSEKVVFTYQHVLNTIDNDDYFDDITDYIDYTTGSFGSFPGDFGPPLFLYDYLVWTKNKLELNKKLPEERKLTLINYVNDILDGRPKDNTDLGLLVSTYDKWYQLFPFDLPFFADSKIKFSKKIPIVSEPLHKNRYTGISKAKLHTKTSLIQILIKITDDLLTSINVLTLYEKGEITDGDKTKLELIIQERKLKLKTGYIKKHGEENGYTKIIREWFKDEKRFIEELIPLILKTPAKNNAYITLAELALKSYYTDQTITRKNSLEIAKLQGHNSGEKLFQLFTKYSSRQNRIGVEQTKKKNLNKLKLLESVVALLPEAHKQRVIDEINTFKAAFDKLTF